MYKKMISSSETHLQDIQQRTLTSSSAQTEQQEITRLVVAGLAAVATVSTPAAGPEGNVLDLEEVWSTPASGRIPSLTGWEAGGVATPGVATGDVVEAAVEAGVESWVHEAQGALAVGDQSVVDEGQDTGGSGRGGRGAVDEDVAAGVDDDEVEALGGQIGVRATVLVVEAGVEVADGVEVRVDSAGLVPWAREVVRETGAADVAVVDVVGDDLRAEVAGGTDGGHVWAGGGEGWHELGGVLAVVGDASAVGTNTAIAGGEEEGGATGAELGELAAGTAGVGFWDGLLVVTVGSGDGVGWVGDVHHVVQPGEVWLVGVGWGLDVWLEWWAAASGVDLDVGWVDDATNGLGVKVGLDVTLAVVGGLWGLHVDAAVDLLNIEGVVELGILALAGQEGVEIGDVGRLVKVGGHTDGVKVGNLGNVVDGVVESAEAQGGDSGLVADSADIWWATVVRLVWVVAWWVVVVSLLDELKLAGHEWLATAKGLGVTEVVGWLDDIDVLVESAGKRVVRSTDDLGAIGILVDVVLSVKELLDGGDWETNNNPVLGRAVVQLVKADIVLLKPFVDGSQAVLGWGNVLVDVGSRQVLAVTLVGWVGDLVEVTLELIEVVLLKTNAEGDGVVLWRTLKLSPLGRDGVLVLDSVCVSLVGWGGGCGRSERGNDGDSSESHDEYELEG